MKLVVNGVTKRLISAQVGDKQVLEIWKGDRKVWPDTGSVARTIEVEIPPMGSIDWMYWMHALDATSEKASDSNYMRFAAGGVNYYLQHSIDGTEAYRVRGSYLYSDLDGALIDELGEYLEVECKIAARKSKTFENTTGEVLPLPYLKGTKLEVFWKNGRDSGWAGCKFSVQCNVDSNVHYGGVCKAAAGRRSHTVELNGEKKSSWYNMVFNDEPDIGENRMFIKAEKFSDFTFKPSVTLLFPSFTRKFKLKILSVS